MRTATPTLTAFLASAKKAVVVDLYTFTLLDGTIYRYTTGQMDITYTYLYSSTGLLIKRNGIKLSRGVQVDALELEIYPTTATIGGIAWLAAVRNGAFDGASLTVTRLFCSDWATPVGSITLFSGQIGEIEISRSMAKLNVVSLLEKFNIQWPYNVYTPACGWELYGDACGLDQVDWTVNGTVIAGSTASIIQTTNSFIYPTTDKVEVDAESSGAPSGWAHTIASYANRILIVGVSEQDSVHCTGVTYGGADLTKKGSYLGISIWYLLTPTIGTANIVVSSDVGWNQACGAVSLYNVDQTNPFRNTETASGNGATYTKTITSSVDDLIVSVGCGWDYGLTQHYLVPNPIQTLHWDIAPGGARGCGTTLRANTTSTIINGTVNYTGDWALYLLAVQVATSGIVIASGYFNQGVLKFTSGLNTGAMRTVRYYDSVTGAITVMPPLEHIPAVSDTFEIYPGCNKLMATCDSKFDNVGNYRGMQFTPVPETAT